MATAALSLPALIDSSIYQICQKSSFSLGGFTLFLFIYFEETIIEDRLVPVA